MVGGCEGVKGCVQGWDPPMGAVESMTISLCSGLRPQP